MTLACSGSGSAGRFAPPLAALHVVWPTLAVIGVPSGCPLTAAAEQFQPAAEADADMTTTLATEAATTQSILRTRDLLWDWINSPNEGATPNLAVSRSLSSMSVERTQVRDERRGCGSGARLRYRLKRPSCCTTSPSALSRPPARRSQMRSQCSAERFLPPVSG